MPTRFIELSCRTLTPIWTGGIDGDPKELITSGLLGGMRWWYEALLRGVMARVPDPTGDHKPQYDSQRGRDALDPASQLFGATGWRRRFRLDIEPNLRPATILRRVESTHKSWFFKFQPLQGEFKIRIAGLDSTLPAVEAMHELLAFQAAWGSLGARPQMGFGIFDVAPLPATDELPKSLKHHVFFGNPEKRTIDDGMPALHNMFFARIAPRPGEPFDETTTFGIKRGIRNLFRADNALRHFLMGYIRPGSDDRAGAKVFVSRPYNGGSEIRVWGWYPRDDHPFADQRGTSLQRIHAFLNSAFQLKVWREAASKERDKRFIPNPLLFLRDLAGRQS